ncbi:MAG: hypothetical protein U5J98_05705 [Halobacteriales archaeon]|nr:hypothetical protein [Halobacteriales archaeon]
MSNEPTTHRYEVHLEAAVAEELGVESPVETERIDYYDSGCWLATEEGRDFVPYDRLLAIRERPAEPEAAARTAEPEAEGPF